MTDAAPLSHREVLVILCSVLVSLLLAALDQTIVATALPTIAADYHSVEHLSWVVSVYLLTSTASTPIYGKLSDFYGRRALLTVAIATFVAASALCAMAQSMTQLIAARALQGIGGGALISLTQATIADVIAPRDRGRYQGYIATVWASASVGGPLLGGFFVDYLSWRWVFWINLPIGLAALVAARISLRKLPVHPVKHRIDYVGALLLVAGVTSLLIVFSSGGAALPWTSPYIIGLGAAGMVLLTLFVAWELRAPEPILPPRLFRNPVVRVANTASFVWSMAFIGGVVFMPLFFQLVVGASASESGMLLMPLTMGVVVGATSSGRFMVKTGRYKAMPLSGLVVSVVIFLYLGQAEAGLSRGLMIACFAILGIGLGLVIPPMLVAVQNAVEKRDLGTATSAVTFFRSMGGSFGVAVLGAVIVSALGHHMNAAAIPGADQLGAQILRDGRAALDALPEPARGQAAAAAARAFHPMFQACAVVCAITFLVVLFLKEIPLRSAQRPTEGSSGT